MESHYELKNGSLIIGMPKELDHHQASQLRMEADLLIETYHIKELVFDFAETEFMDSSGIGVIIGRCKNMHYFGGEVVAKNLSDRLQKIFIVSGLHKIMQEGGANSGKAW